MFQGMIAYLGAQHGVKFLGELANGAEFKEVSQY